MRINRHRIEVSSAEVDGVMVEIANRQMSLRERSSQHSTYSPVAGWQVED